jgi:hypothetical protein
LSCFAICFSAKSKSKTCSVAQWGQGCRFESRLRRTILNSFAHSLQLIVSSIGKFHFIQWYLEHCSGPAGHSAEYPRFSGNGYQEVTGPNKKSRSIVSGKGGLTEDGRATICCAELQLAASIWQESHRPPHDYFRRKRPSRRPVTPPPSPGCTYDRVCRELPRLFSEIVERMQLLWEQTDILVVIASAAGRRSKSTRKAHQ